MMQNWEERWRGPAKKRHIDCQGRLEERYTVPTPFANVIHSCISVNSCILGPQGEASAQAPGRLQAERFAGMPEPRILKNS